MNEQTLEFVCPHCGKEDALTYSYSLHAQKDPERYSKLLSGTLFDYVCPECGNRIHLTYGLLFHDPAHKAMCFYVPDEKEVPGIIDSIRAAHNTEGGDSLGNYAVRIVTEDHKLTEKALIWSLGLDDKAVEMWKLTYLYHIIAHNEDFEADDSVMRVENGAYKIDFYRENEYLGTVEADPSLISNVKDRFLSRDTGVIENDLFVDTAWAMDHLTNLLHRPESSEPEDAPNQ
ncbi:MAG: CpXC domain-containing protein [Erysipelotrichales bacterium]|nr:CpXC domain-containing protein [Erysipelotrichales bacterium]